MLDRTGSLFFPVLIELFTEMLFGARPAEIQTAVKAPERHGQVPLPTATGTFDNQIFGSCLVLCL
jgi:hypothetical protein